MPPSLGGADAEKGDDTLIIEQVSTEGQTTNSEKAASSGDLQVSSPLGLPQLNGAELGKVVTYRLYKRRFVGCIALVREPSVCFSSLPRSI